MIETMIGLESSNHFEHEMKGGAGVSDTLRQPSPLRQVPSIATNGTAAPLEPLTPEQRENWRRMLAVQFGLLPSDEYIEMYRAALQAIADSASPRPRP